MNARHVRLLVLAGLALAIGTSLATARPVIPDCTDILNSMLCP